MAESLDISQLLVLRKVTRAVSDRLSCQLSGHLATLAPLYRPRAIFGKHVSSSVKRPVPGEREAYEQLCGLYKSLVDAGKLRLPREELESPLELGDVAPEVSPVTYSYTAGKGKGSKSITVTAPLKWHCTCRGHGLPRLEELAASRDAAKRNDLRRCVLHLLALHVGLARHAGTTEILNALRFHVGTDHLEQYGKLPITQFQSPLHTFLPSDDVIIQSTEISGTSAFEEVVDLEAIANLQDPLKDELAEIVKQAGGKLPQESASAKRQRK